MSQQKQKDGASRAAKLKGLKSIREASKLLDISSATLHRQFNEDRQVFDSNMDFAMEKKRYKN